VIDFLPGVAGGEGRGQKLMESERMVKIYESKWWRANKFFALFMGIDLKGEMALIKRIASPGPAAKVLDLACGPGLYARAFAEENPGREIFGLDISWPMLRYAVAKARKLAMRNVTFMHGDAHHLPFKDSSLDAANCCGALHLFSDVRRVLGELGRVIRTGGRFSAAAALVRPRSAFSRLKGYLDGKFWHIHYFRQGELADLLDEAGFEPTVYHARGIWMIAGGVRRR
jgi:ubiquinone/menaquinone biosynthesis C-methylase UbiE